MLLPTALRKLYRINSTELLFRSRAVVNRWYEEGCYSLGLDFQDGADARLEGQTVFPDPWIDTNDYGAIKTKLCSEYPEYVEEICEAADGICNRQFTLLGVPVQYGPTISWNEDLLSEKAWPSEFYTRLKIFSGDTGIGDVKYVWELNRHQFLVTLGKAYRLTGDEGYVSAGVDLIQDWIRDNPYKIGINWTSALEVAIRALSWCQACALFSDAAVFGSEKRRTILRSLQQHGQYVEKHLSFFFSPYNHLIGEAAALFVLGNSLLSLKSALRWRVRGWRILEEEVSKQFYSDGGTVEQATGYHHFTLGFYLQGILSRRRVGEMVPSPMWSLLEKAFEFSMYIMRPDGLIPMIGDGDDGKAIDLLQTSVWDVKPLLAVASTLFQRGDFKAVAGRFPPDAAWLLGREGWKRYEALREVKPAENSRMLSESGYCIMRTAWDRESHYLNFDCGDIAAGVSPENIPSAAHGHADTLSVEVSAYGVPILVDPGFYTYNGAEKWHRYFRETKAHNTVVVDGCSQAEYRGRLKWSHAPKVRLEHCMLSTVFDYVEASHNGYRRLAQPVVHRRAVVFVKPDYWLIRDELWGEGEHQIDRYFHFAPGKLIRQRTGTAVHARLQRGGNLAVISVENEGMAVESKFGGNEPEDGWLAMSYGKKTQAPVVCYSTKATLPIALNTLLVPFRKDVPDVRVDTIQLPSGNPVLDQGFIVTMGGKKDILFFVSGNHDRAIEFNSKGWLTNGRFSCLRFDTEDEILSCALVAGSILVIADSVLWQAKHKVPFVSVSFQNGQAVIEKPKASDV